MGRGDQLARTWQLLTRLERSRTRGLTVEELCEEGGWHKRTLYRDINALIDSGFPIEKESLEGRVYYRMSKWFKEALPPTFTLTEVVALNLSSQMMKSLEGTFFYNSLETAFAKIKAILSPQTIQYLSQIEESLYANSNLPKDFKNKGPLMDKLYEAIIQKKVCEIKYNSASSKETTIRIVEPLKMWFSSDLLYLVAHDRKHKEPRTFSCARIEACKILEDQKFTDQLFDFESYRGTALRVWRSGEAENICLRFAATVAQMIESKMWHDSQKTEIQKNGDAILTMKVSISPELVSWILSWGSQVTVEAPNSLRAKILETALEIYDHYDGHGLPLPKAVRNSK